MATEIVTSIPRSIMEKIVDVLFNATVRQFGYLCKHKRNIKELRTEAKKLTDRRNDLQAEIDAATRNGEAIKDEVQRWIAEVDDIIPQAEKFLEDEVKVNKKCLGGLCVDLKSRYKLSREAEEKTLAISGLVAGGNFGKDVSRPTPPPAIISSSEGFYFFKSRELAMSDILEAMKNENVSIIGICGMGGVGKTTLVKEIQKEAKEKKMFDEVAMAVVSQTPSITKIQDEIAGWLGVKRLPDSDESARASFLWARIKEKQRVLVILDDLWGRIKLSEVGIPYGKDHRGCNILLTSRSRAVCNQMNAHKIVEVGTLTEGESWSLFREVAGPEVDNPEINPTARVVADGCGGLPIAILTIGTALKDRDEHVWKDAAEQLKSSTPTNIEGMEEFVVSRLELSYNYLKSEEAKSIFRLCSCFPEDYNIPIEVLARYGLGLRCLQNVDSVEKARGRARSAVSTLIFSYLLIGGEEGFVKMHDVVRYVAQQIASKNKFVIKAGVKLKDWPSINTYEDLTGISLMFNDIHELPDGLECPKLQALFLQKNSHLVIPDRFFQGIEDLKVLDLGRIRRFSLPSSLSFLINLKTLRLDNCFRLGNLSLIGRLSRLEILDLSESDVSEIPVSFGSLDHLRLLDLTDCDRLGVIPRGVLSSLCKLEELYMSNSFDHWQFGSEEDSRSNAKFIELGALSRLTGLHIEIPKGKIMPSDMSFQNLTSFSITIGIEEDFIRDFIGAFFRKFKKRCSRAMGFSQDMRISVQHTWIKNLLLRSEILALVEVNGLENIVSDLANDGFNELMFLSISGCNEMKYLLNSMERTRRVTFHKLEWLAVLGNPNFVEICHGQLPAGYLSNVKRLDVEDCDSILKILPSHLVQSFQSLQRLRVRSCELLVSAFEIERVNIAKEETELFSSFEKLTLFNLPQMTDIWKGDTQFVRLHNLKKVSVQECDELIQVFPATVVPSLNSLERMVVLGCSNLKEIFGKKAATEEMVPYSERRDHIHIHAATSTSSPTPSLGNLVSITIERCGKLLNLFTTSMVKSLVRLEWLAVRSCPTLQEIIMDDEGEVGLQGATTQKITFPSLYSIQLSHLDSLACFCSSGSHATIEFPALEALQIVDCPSMKTFGYGDQLTPKLLKGVALEDGGRHWMGNLNQTIQQYVYNEKKIWEKEPMKSGISSETTSSQTEN